MTGLVLTSKAVFRMSWGNMIERLLVPFKLAGGEMNSNFQYSLAVIRKSRRVQTVVMTSSTKLPLEALLLLLFRVPTLRFANAS